MNELAKEEQEKVALIEELDGVRNSLLEAVNPLWELAEKSAQSRELIAGISPTELSIKDIVGISLRWNEKVLEEAKKLIRGRSPDLKFLEDPETFDQAAVEAYKDSPFIYLLGRLYKVSWDRHHFLDRLREAGVFGECGIEFRGQRVTVAWLVDTSARDKEHTDQILALREEKGL